MQTVSRSIRAARVEQAIEEGASSFTVRQAQVAAIAEAIITGGQPELHSDSSALCSHFKLRKGYLLADGGGMDSVEALVYTHAAGYVVRLWICEADFSVKVRDLILMPSAKAKGFDTWLDTRADGEGGRLFPHSGKYLMPGLKILSHCLLGR